MFRLRVWWAITRETWREWRTYRNRTFFAFRATWRKNAKLCFLTTDGHIDFMPF